MADRKPLLVNKDFYNFINDETIKGTPETTEKMFKTLQGIFCKGRYQSWTVLPEHLRKKQKTKKPEKENPTITLPARHKKDGS